MRVKLVSSIFLIFIIILVSLGILIFGLSDEVLISKLNSLSTILLAIFTLIYVFLTYLILRSNNKMVTEQNRPFVILSLPTEGTNLILLIRNIGKRPAYNVKISLSSNIKNLITLKGFTFEKSVLPFLSQKFLPPGIDIRNIIGQTMKILELSEEQKKIEISIDYSDSFKNIYSDNYEIDLNNSISLQKIVQEHKPVYYFKKISDNLDEIHKVIKSRKS